MHFLSFFFLLSLLTSQSVISSVTYPNVISFLLCALETVVCGLVSVANFFIGSTTVVNNILCFRVRLILELVLSVKSFAILSKANTTFEEYTSITWLDYFHVSIVKL